MSLNPPLGERRVVTVMSVDIAGSTRLLAGLDPDDAQALLDMVFARIQTAAESLAGTIVAFTGDGALVVFGWPEPSERHADHACRAASRIQAMQTLTGPDGQPVRLRIGLATGLVMVRRIAFGFAARHDVIGDAAHRAAALQKRAPIGGGLICESTHALLQAPQGAPAAAFDLGLRTGPVRAYALLDAPDETPAEALGLRHRTPMIGRDHEAGRLRRLIADAPQVMALACIAEPGLGKSRLAAAAAETARQAGRRVILHECRDLDVASPFAAARALIRSVLDGRDLHAVAARALPDADEHAAALAVLAASDGAGPPPAGAIAQRPIARALARLMAGEALSGPMLVIVEDLHNIDPESAEVLSALAGLTPAFPLAVFVTGRPESREAASAICREVMLLPPLGDESLARLIASAADAGDLPAADSEALIARAAGNPFLLAQLLAAHLAGSRTEHETQVPRSVEALIHARLDRLGAGARQLAQSLGVLGETVDRDLAAAAAGGADHLNGPAMAELERLAFIHPPAAGAIRFRHALIAAACASSLARNRRREVHDAALAALLSRTDDRSGLYPRLAHHAEQAGRDAEAIGFLWEAARRARSLGASQSLMATFDRALACCLRLGREGETHFVDFVLLAFETFHLQGEISRIEDHLARAADYAAAQGRREKACIAQCHRGIAAWYHGRFQEGERIMRPALAEARDIGHLPLRFAAQFILAQQLHNQGRIEEAVQNVVELAGILAGEHELARLGAMGLPASIASSHAGYYLLETPHHAQAEAYIRKGLEIAIRGADAYSEALARIALGRCFLLTGRNAEAVDCLRRGAAIIEQRGYDPALLNVSGLLATALSRTGRPEDAIALAEACLGRGLFARTGSYERHYFLCGYGEALVAGGRIGEGLARIDEAIAIGRATANPCILVQALSLKRAALQASDGDGAAIADHAAEVALLESRHGLAAPRGAFSRA